jgi:hypothetical protein
MDTPHLSVPTPDELRQQIRARVDEVRALRRMLSLAEAAEMAAEARTRQLPVAELLERARRGREASHD